MLSKCIFLCHCLCLCLCHCLFFGPVMSSHHSDQMSQRSQVSGVALCISKVKVPSVSQSVSEWQGHLLSCSGQLNSLGWQYEAKGHFFAETIFSQIYQRENSSSGDQYSIIPPGLTAWTNQRQAASTRYPGQPMGHRSVLMNISNKAIVFKYRWLELAETAKWCLLMSLRRGWNGGTMRSLQDFPQKKMVCE